MKLHSAQSGYFTYPRYYWRGAGQSDLSAAVTR
jgi:hypothetical protein